MDLKTYIKDLGDELSREAFAERVGTKLGHLRNVGYGLRPCAPELATAIELDSGRTLRRWDLRPEDWHRIWPELIGTEGAPAVEPAEAKAG
jgi:DNA-binding transcriptional regulator YdaS (Cro superfamily)